MSVCTAARDCEKTLGHGRRSAGAQGRLGKTAGESEQAKSVQPLTDKLFFCSEPLDASAVGCSVALFMAVNHEPVGQIGRNEPQVHKHLASRRLERLGIVFDRLECGMSVDVRTDRNLCLIHKH